jgi:Tol biopolymer transport system component
MKFIYIILSFTLIFISCTRVFEPSNTMTPNTVMQGKIVFVSDRDVYLHNQLYLMNCDGSNQMRITHDSIDYRYPVFSPDGSKILFYSNTPDDSDEIYIIDEDGNNLLNITCHPGDDNLPAYSPNGAYITFTSTRDGNREIYIMDSNGQNQTRLTFNNIIDHSPQFTSNGLNIMYYSWEPDEREYNINIMDIDGSNKKCLTEEGLYFLTKNFVSDRSFNMFDAMPCISPDGSTIVFSSYNIKLNDYSIFMIDIDGTNQKLVTNELGYNLAPFFSPEGDKIIFRSHRGWNYDLYEMDLDGKNQRNLTNDSGHAYFSQFSPDGSKILFNTDREQYYKIWIMNQDGSNQTQLTFGDYNDYYPRFQTIMINN